MFFSIQKASEREPLLMAQNISQNLIQQMLLISLLSLTQTAAYPKTFSLIKTAWLWAKLF